MKFLKKFLLLPVLMLCFVMAFAACDDNTNPALVDLPDKAWSVSYVEGSTIITRTSFVVFKLDLSNAVEISETEYNTMEIRGYLGSGDIRDKSNLFNLEVNRDKKITSRDFDVNSIGSISNIGIVAFMPSSDVTYSIPVIEAKVYYQKLKVEGNLLKIQIYNITNSNGSPEREIVHNEIVLSNIKDASAVRVFNENGTLRSMDFGVSFQFFN